MICCRWPAPRTPGCRRVHPAGVDAALALAPWVVVRRTACAGGLTAVGVRARCRIDVQVEGGMGAFALVDCAQHQRILLRTPHGVFLSDDPWRERAL